MHAGRDPDAGTESHGEVEEQNEMRQPAVFLDRDGTINEQMGYINHISRFHLLPGVRKAVRSLNDQGYLAIVVSNQSGVARGYFPIELVHSIHEYMKKLMNEGGARIDEVFFCPHHPSGEVTQYAGSCDCRKPEPGLIRQATECFGIDLEASYVIGDRYTDIVMAHRLGLRGILVKTGYGLGDLEYVLPKKHLKPNYIATDLLDAVTWIIKSQTHKG